MNPTNPSRFLVLGLLASLPATAADGIDHPYCLWTREEASQIRKRLQTDPIAKKQYQRTVQRIAERHKLDGLCLTPAFMDLFNFLVLDDKEAGERQKKALLGFIGLAPEPMRIAFTLDEENHRWVIGGRSHNDRHHGRDRQELNALRYDILYHELTPQQRRAVEDTMRLYIEFHLAGAKPWHPDFRYDRTSWLPNMHWPRPIATHFLAAALGDEALIKAMFHSAGGFKWFMDEYLGDGRFYMEESCKYECIMNTMLWYCEAVERLGLGRYGYGYVGANGGSARNYVEMFPRVGLPRIETPGGRPQYPMVNMGDSGDSCIVRGCPPGQRPHEVGRRLMNFEMYHRRFPKARFDYFLAQMRAPGEDVYLPSPYFGLAPIDPRQVEPPPAAPSYASRGRGFALLRAQEGPAYWASPRPAVALQFGMYYVHYVHDCFSILQYVAHNRMIYRRTGKLNARGYTAGDAFRDHVRGHCGVVVDGLQAQPVDDGNAGTPNHRVRERFAKPVKFVSVRAQHIYPDVDQERALFLTDEYLFDVFWLKGIGAAARKKRVYDWQVLTFGETEGTDTSPWVVLEKFPDKARAGKPYLEDIRVLDAGARPWTAAALFAPGKAASHGVRVSMLGAKDTLVLSSMTPEDTGYGGSDKAQRGRSILATRTAPATVFAALHEPFDKGSRSARVTRYERIQETDEGIGVRIVGGPGSGVDDRILYRYGANAASPVTLADDKESYTFADHVYLRITGEAVNAVGSLQAIKIRVTGKPRLIVNGEAAPARIADGLLQARVER